MFNIKNAAYAAKVLNVSFYKFTIGKFIDGNNIDLENACTSSLTNITNDDLIMTSKIALAHLNEFPNYYDSVYGIKSYLKNKL